MGKQGQAKKILTSTPTKRNHRSKSREDEQDVRDARRALKEARKKGAVSWEQVKREAGI
jgi:hypothetical protein